MLWGGYDISCSMCDTHVVLGTDSKADSTEDMTDVVSGFMSMYTKTLVARGARTEWRHEVRMWRAPLRGR